MAANPPAVEGDVRLERRGDGLRADLVLDRPAKLNALTLAMLDRLGAHAAALRAQPPRVIVLRGAGPRAFSVGADVAEWAALSPAEALWASERGTFALDALGRLPCPVICAVHGFCLGGGLELALACDLRIAAADAVAGFPEVTLGNGTSWGGAARLVALTGLGTAKRMMLTGRTVDAEEALRLGIVGEVAADGDLDGAVDRTADRIAANAPIAVATVKRQLDALAGPTRSSALIEALGAGTHAGTEDARAGKAALQARAEPVFEGR
jgi:enoyl-CoA hydratase/carnithine racemase